MSDVSVSPAATPVNDNPPAAETPSGLEANRHYLLDMIGLALDRLESAATAALRAVRAAEMVKAAADEVNDREAAWELGAIVDAISDIPNSFADAQNDLEAIYEEREPKGDGPVVDADDIEDNGEDDESDGEDNKVAGYLAVDQSTSDRVIEGFIAAVGADRVLGALDRLTAPVNASTTN